MVYRTRVQVPRETEYALAKEEQTRKQAGGKLAEFSVGKVQEGINALNGFSPC